MQARSESKACWEGSLQHGSQKVYIVFVVTMLYSVKHGSCVFESLKLTDIGC